MTQTDNTLDNISDKIPGRSLEKVVFQNDACVVVNKIPGEDSEAPYFELPGKSLLPVHRLDKPASGCLLLAKTPDAAAFLGAAFARRGRVEKRYWAIIERPVSEKPFPPEGELVHLVGVDRKANKAFAIRADSVNVNPLAEAPLLKKRNTRMKEAVLRYRLAGEGERYLFLEIDLVTGRHHQIRAQLAAIGLHIKGDLKYGARRSEKTGGIRLHAYSLAFPNPLKAGDVIRVEALPPVMDALWCAFKDACFCGMTRGDAL